MPVTSAIDIYTSLLGWHLYNSIWYFLVATGLVLLPFIITAFSVIRESISSAGVGSEDTMKALEFSLIPMLAVLFIIVQPTINLHLENMSYYPSACKADGSTGSATQKTLGDTGTTYDFQESEFTAMMDGRIAKIPLWWYFFMKLNTAVSISLVNELPCKPDIRSSLTDLAQLKLSDNNLKGEVQQFYNDCYVPAANKYQRAQLRQDEIPNALRDNLDEDIAWLGSRFFSTQTGYYDQLRPSKAIKAIPYSPLRGDDVKGPDLLGTKLSPGPGWPTCDIWWNDRENGLRKRVLADVKSDSNKFGLGADKSLYDKTIGRWLPSSTEADNLLIKQAVYAPANKPSLDTPLSAESSTEGLNGAVKDLLVDLGLNLKVASARIETATMKAAGPVVQALVLMMFVLSLPLLAFFSMFDLNTMVRLTVVHFSVVFWTFLFALAGWLDNFLLDSLLNTQKGNISPSLVNFMTRSDQSVERNVINWISMFGYVALPVLFTILMNMVGKGLSLSLEAVFGGLSGNASKAATSAVDAIRSLTRLK